MRKTIAEVIGACEVCLRTKYDRHLPRGRQVETPTTDAPLKHLQIDIFTWRGYIFVTIIYPFSKAAMAHQVQERSSEVLLGALQM